MLTDSQLAERCNYIGASEAAACIGLDPYRQPLDVWLEKCGLMPAPDLSGKECVEAGNVFEPAIRGWASQRLGVPVEVMPETQYHPDHAWMACHPDGALPGGRAGLEIKNRSFFLRQKYGPEGSDQVSDSDLCQCQHTMAVMGWDLMHMAVVFGGQSLVLFNVPRDDEFILDMVAAERALWGMVERREQPGADWSHPTTLGLIKRLYPGTDGSIRPLPAHALDLHQRRVEALRRAKEATAEADAVKAQLLDMLGPAAVGVLPGGVGAYRRKLIPIVEAKAREYVRDDFRFSSKLDKSEEVYA